MAYFTGSARPNSYGRIRSDALVYLSLRSEGLMLNELEDAILWANIVYLAFPDDEETQALAEKRVRDARKAYQESPDHEEYAPFWRSKEEPDD